MINKRLPWLILLLILAPFVFGACIDAAKEGPTQKIADIAENKVPLALSVLRLTMSTGVRSGNYYPFGAAMAQVVGDVSKYLVIDVQTSTDTRENIERIAAGQAQLALVQGDILSYAWHGSEMWSDKPPVSCLAPLMALYPEVCQLVAAANAGLDTVEDLEGKRVAIGEEGTALRAGALHILAAYGLTEEDIEAVPLCFSDAAQALREKTVDAFFAVAGTPNKGMMDLQAGREITIIGLDEEKIAELIAKYPFYTPYTLDENDYSFLTQPVHTVALKITLAATDSLSEQTAYDLVKTIIENRDKIAVANAKGMYIKAEEAVKGLPVELHAGARRYFMEIGALKETPPPVEEAEEQEVIQN